MTLRDFVHEYQDDIDSAIIRCCPNIGTVDDEEREMWVLNDEGLYTLALDSGVRGLED